MQCGMQCQTKSEQNYKFYISNTENVKNRESRFFWKCFNSKRKKISRLQYKCNKYRIMHIKVRQECADYFSQYFSIYFLKYNFQTNTVIPVFSIKLNTYLKIRLYYT